jgi:hypothetical protein
MLRRAIIIWLCFRSLTRHHVLIHSPDRTARPRGHTLRLQRFVRGASRTKHQTSHEFSINYGRCSQSSMQLRVTGHTVLGSRMSLHLCLRRPGRPRARTRDDDEATSISKLASNIVFDLFPLLCLFEISTRFAGLLENARTLSPPWGFEARRHRAAERGCRNLAKPMIAHTQSAAYT